MTISTHNVASRRAPAVFSALLFTTISLLAGPAAHAAFKCKAADGKIEYSDRPCDTSKDTLDKPNANKGIQTKAIGNPLEQLEKLFGEYQPRLCEREKLAAEIDIANRSGELTKNAAAWRPKQDQLLQLNEVQVDFQQRAGKITRPAGNESKEMAALRKFQLGLRDCSRQVMAPATPAAPAAPAKTPTAAGAPAKPATK
jgi:hypothetical protein